MAHTMPPDQHKIRALEGLRGLMAWWVVLGHLTLAAGWRLPLIRRSTLAVDVFIVLSGFVIALLVAQRREAYRPYITRRAFRIFPLYLAVLAVSTVMLPLALQAWLNAPFPTLTNGNRLMLAQTATQNLPAHVLVHIPLLQGLVPPGLLPGAAWTLVGQAWSVSLEWQFYLVAPLMVWGLATPRRAVAAVAVMALAAFSSRGLTQGYLGSYIWHFGLGIATYSLVTNPEARRFYGPLALFFGAAALYRGGAWQLLPLGLWVAAATCAAGVRWVRPLSSFLSRPALVRMGELSYSTYLVHMIPMTLAVYVLNQLDLSQLTYTLLLLGTAIPATYGLSVLTFRWIEKPGMAWGAAMAGRHPPPALTATARP